MSAEAESRPRPSLPERPGRAGVREGSAGPRRPPRGCATTSFELRRWRPRPPWGSLGAERSPAVRRHLAPSDPNPRHTRSTTGAVREPERQRSAAQEPLEVLRRDLQGPPSLEEGRQAPRLPQADGREARLQARAGPGGQHRGAQARQPRPREGAEGALAGPRRHGLREEQGDRARLRQRPDPGLRRRRVGQGQGHHPGRRQRHRGRRRARAARGQGCRPPAARAALHDRRGDRADRRQGP